MTFFHKSLWHLLLTLFISPLLVNLEEPFLSIHTTNLIHRFSIWECFIGEFWGVFNCMRCFQQNKLHLERVTSHLIICQVSFLFQIYFLVGFFFICCSCSPYRSSCLIDIWKGTRFFILQQSQCVRQTGLVFFYCI